MLAQEELVEHGPEIRISCAGIHQHRLRMPFEHVAQRRLEQLHQVVHLLELAQAVGVQRSVAADQMQLLEQPDRLSRQQLAPHLFTLRLTHRPRHVPQDVVEQGAMLFAVCAPGLEPVLASEIRALGFPGRALAGGVEAEGDLREAMRLNLWLRTGGRFSARLGEPFRATTFAELVRQASALPWERFLRKRGRVAFRVTCRKSRLYHSGAVAERLHAALESRTRFPVPLAQGAGEEAPADAQLFLARFERDVCTVTVAARKQERRLPARVEASDQDAGAVAATSENAARAGVEIAVNQRRLADLPPDPGGGLMACNLPYGVRIAADARTLFDELAAAAHRRPAWRVAIVAASARGASGLRLTTLLRTKSGGIPIHILVSP